MRTKLFGFMLGCGLVVAAVTPSLACSFNNQAS
jgi:hypothetical protein